LDQPAFEFRHANDRENRTNSRLAPKNAVMKENVSLLVKPKPLRHGGHPEVGHFFTMTSQNQAMAGLSASPAASARGRRMTAPRSRLS
jgi:hypothetical protein